MGEQDVADQRGAFACREGPGLMPRAAFRVFGARGSRALTPRRPLAGGPSPAAPSVIYVSRCRPVPLARAVPGHD